MKMRVVVWELLFGLLLVNCFPSSKIQHQYPQICLTTADCPALNQVCARFMDEGYGHCAIKNDPRIESPADHAADHTFMAEKKKPSLDSAGPTEFQAGFPEPIILKNVMNLPKKKTSNAPNSVPWKEPIGGISDAMGTKRVADIRSEDQFLSKSRRRKGIQWRHERKHVKRDVPTAMSLKDGLFHKEVSPSHAMEGGHPVKNEPSHATVDMLKRVDHPEDKDILKKVDHPEEKDILKKVEHTPEKKLEHVPTVLNHNDPKCDCQGERKGDLSDTDIEHLAKKIIHDVPKLSDTLAHSVKAANQHTAGALTPQSVNDNSLAAHFIQPQTTSAPDPHVSEIIDFKNTSTETPPSSMKDAFKAMFFGKKKEENHTDEHSPKDLETPKNDTVIVKHVNENEKKDKTTHHKATRENPMFTGMGDRRLARENTKLHDQVADQITKDSRLQHDLIPPSIKNGGDIPGKVGPVPHKSNTQPMYQPHDMKPTSTVHDAKAKASFSEIKKHMLSDSNIPQVVNKIESEKNIHEIFDPSYFTLATEAPVVHLPLPAPPTVEVKKMLLVKQPNGNSNPMKSSYDYSLIEAKDSLDGIDIPGIGGDNRVSGQPIKLRSKKMRRGLDLDLDLDSTMDSLMTDLDNFGKLTDKAASLNAKGPGRSGAPDTAPAPAPPKNKTTEKSTESVTPKMPVEIKDTPEHPVSPDMELSIKPPTTAKPTKASKSEDAKIKKLFKVETTNIKPSNSPLELVTSEAIDSILDRIEGQLIEGGVEPTLSDLQMPKESPEPDDKQAVVQLNANLDSYRAGNTKPETYGWKPLLRRIKKHSHHNEHGHHGRRRRRRKRMLGSVMKLAPVYDIDEYGANKNTPQIEVKEQVTERTTPDWTPCSVTCGLGMRRKLFFCNDPVECQHMKPMVKPCMMPIC